MLLLLFLMAGLCLAWPFGANRDEVVHSLSAPNVSFRSPRVFSTKSPTRRVQNHMEMTMVPNHRMGGRPSAASLLASLQLDGGQHGFGNISVVDRFATQYAVDILLNGAPMRLVIDTGSSDTWVKGLNFSCSSPGNDTTACSLGPAYPDLDFPGGHLKDQHFYILYGDNETIAGQLGLLDVKLGGITVHDQEIGLASQGQWTGDNVTSGVLGMAYPALTSAYWSDSLAENDPVLATTYSPLFTSMINDGLVEPYWTLAISRNSSKGTFALGGLPPINLNSSHVSTTYMIIADIAHKGTSGYQPSFYTIVPTGIIVDQSEDRSRYPYIIDSSTTQTYLPPHVADQVNAKFDPPATYLWYYNAYYTNCDAITPRFAIEIEDSPYYINPSDMINQDQVDPLTGLCATGINSGGNGPYVLGLSFLVNVAVEFNIGAGAITFWSREFDGE
ncbi:aspartic-type endopeptidase-like protein [Xylariales sp. AK1849]|nr:aspartic-type endopeptidase-like protein [Xylariales sp. AK1849]